MPNHAVTEIWQAVYECLEARGTKILTSHVLIGKHNVPGIYVVTTAETANMLLVFAFGSQSTIRIWPGSHKLGKTRIPNQPLAPFIRIESKNLGEGRLIGLRGGGRVVLDPRTAFYIPEGEATLFQYRADAKDVPKMRFPRKLQSLLRELEILDCSINAEFL